MTDHAQREKALQARLGQLQARLGQIDGALSEPRSPDWEEQATEREGDEVLIELGEAGTAEIRQINAALARISAGTYGECSRCGETIAPERLDALPATPLCLACAGQVHPHP